MGERRGVDMVSPVAEIQSVKFAQGRGSLRSSTALAGCPVGAGSTSESVHESLSSFSSVEWEQSSWPASNLPPQTEKSFDLSGAKSLGRPCSLYAAQQQSRKYYLGGRKEMKEEWGTDCVQGSLAHTAPTPLFLSIYHMPGMASWYIYNPVGKPGMSTNSSKIFMRTYYDLGKLSCNPAI